MRFVGGHKNAKILYIYRAPYSYHGEYKPTVTMVIILVGWVAVAVVTTAAAARDERGEAPPPGGFEGGSAPEYIRGAPPCIHHGNYRAVFPMVTIGSPIYWIMHFYDPQKTFKNP